MDTGPANILEGSLSAMRKQHAVAPDVFSLLCFISSEENNFSFISSCKVSLS